MTLPPEVLLRVTTLLPPVLVHAVRGEWSTARVWPLSLAAPAGTARNELACDYNIHETLFLPGGERLVTTTWDGGWATSTVWSLRSRSKGATFARLCPPQFLGMSRVFPDGERIVSMSAGGHALVVWNATSGVPTQRFDLNITVGDTLLEVRVLHPGDRLVIARSWATAAAVVIMNATSGRLLHSLVHNSSVQCMEVSPCGGKVVTAGDGGLFLWNAVTGALDLHIGVRVTSWRPKVQVSRSGAKIFVNMGRSISVWEGGRGELSSTITMDSMDACHVYDFAILPEGRRLVVVSLRSANVWDVEAGMILQTLSGSNVHGSRSGLTLALSASGDAVATCSTVRRLVGSHWRGDEAKYAVDYTAQVWDLASGRALHTHQETIQILRSVDITPPMCSVAVSSVSQQLLESFVG